MMKVMDETFGYESRGMISGQGRALDRVYEMHVGKSGRAWFVPYLQTNAADDILVTAYDDWSKTGEGFGGATLNLKLKDGSSFPLKGGWHTSAEGLKEDTGVDLTGTHLTYGAIGLVRVPGYMAIGELLYKDEKPTCGHFMRIKDMAVDLANEYGVTVYYCVMSEGGGSCGPVNPGEEKSGW